MCILLKKKLKKNMNRGLAIDEKRAWREKKNVHIHKEECMNCGLGKMCILVKKKLKKNLNRGLAFDEKLAWREKKNVHIYKEECMNCGLAFDKTWIRKNVHNGKEETKEKSEPWISFRWKTCMKRKEKHAYI